ncbi:hypothetical protein ACFV3R_17815 [Streptomyces sp. NPDC059740]|uniref:hypothetical protein n=1 Tax=Streptomyces sp. NPDC059740 TaxID=3346926 RepID=UPI00365CE1CF
MDSRHEAASGIAQLEGYLLWQQELGDARSRAEAFADRMEWLTEGQREEVVRLYAEDHLDLSRAALRRIADRCGELREEYTERYDQLRVRLLCRTTAVVVGMVALCCSALLVAGVH